MSYNDVDKAIRAACVAQTGFCNEFQAGGDRFIINASRRDSRDGSTSGTIDRVLPESIVLRPDGRVDSFRAVIVARWKIGPDGKILKGTKFLKPLVEAQC